MSYRKVKNKVIEIFIILLFTFQRTISILVLIDRLSYEYNEFQYKDTLFPIEDFIREKYYATNSIFWGTLKANYEWTSLLGYFIRPIAIQLDIATENSPFLIYYSIGLLIYTLFVLSIFLLLKRFLYFVVSKCTRNK